MSEPGIASHDVSADIDRRFGGLRRLYGDAAQRIFDAHVCVVGVGGVGSWVAEALVRSGVGRLTLIDMDHVAESNINRQVHALTPTVGQAKVLAMRDRLQLIHPGAEIRVVDDFVTPANWADIVAAAPASHPFDGVVDACDDKAAKCTLAAWALQSNASLVTVGAAGGKRAPHRVEMGDLSVVTHDPLLARLRYQLRREHGAPRDGAIGVTCIFSREPVSVPDTACATDPVDGSLNCHGYGSSVTVTATFGLCAAATLMESLAHPSRSRKKMAARSKR